MSEVENKIEELKFDDVLNVCIDYLKNFGNEESTEKFEEIRKKLVIRDYLSINQKEIVLKKILMDLTVQKDEPQIFAISSEICLFFDALLAYTNINPEIDGTFKISEVYDIFSYVGLADYIYEFCKKDYERIVNMLDRAISWSNVEMLMQSVEDLDGEKLENLNKQFAEFTSENNLDMLGKIKDILGYNDPIVTTVKNNIEETAYQETKKASEPPKD